MTTAEILVLAFGVIHKASQLIRELLVAEPDLDLAASEAAVKALDDDLEGYAKSWALIRGD